MKTQVCSTKIIHSDTYSLRDTQKTLLFFSVPAEEELVCD